MRLLAMVLFVVFSITQLDAQVKKILHQSFEIEEMNDVKLDLAGDYEIVEWAGNAILVETNIELYSASRDIYNFFKENGRYDVEADSASTMITLRSVDKERKPIRSKKGECFEIIRVRVLIPEDFDVVDQQTLVRIDPEANDSNK